MIHLETAGYMILHEPQYLLYAGCSNVQLFCFKMKKYISQWTFQRYLHTRR